MRTKLLTLALITTTLFTFSNIQAQNWWKNGTKGEGPVVKKSLNISSFDGFTLTTTGTVYLRQGSTQSVEVETHQNLIDILETSVSNKHWKIKFNKSVRNYDKLVFYITVPTLTAANISGSGDIIAETAFTGLGDLRVAISGSGDIKMNAQAQNITSKISGSGDIALKGKANNMEIGISGSGDVSAYDMIVENCKISISGSGDVKVHANEELYVRSSGSGDVFYKGRPRIESKVSGSSDITSRQ